MKGNRPKIFIIALTLFIISLSTSGQSETFYRCVNSKGSSILTNSFPTDPEYKCTTAASFREPSPQERVQEQRETQRKMTQQEYQRKAQGDRQEYDNQMKQEYDAQKKKKVELEKNWLENRRKALSSGSSKKFEQTVNETMDKRKEQLEKDPDQYFYDKEQREKAAAVAASHRKSNSGSSSGPASVIDPQTGRVVHGFPTGDGGVVDSQTGKVIHGAPIQ